MPINKERYPPDWKWRSQRIKKRDGYQCQHCFARDGETGVHDPEGAWLPENRLKNTLGKGRAGKLKLKKIVLTVAHLDHDETNWDVEDDRLLSLCAACHLRYDKHDNASRRAYGKCYRDNQPTLF